MKHETRLTRCISGTLQGAGGVGGLLAVKRNGVWYAPLYDANGNVTAYVSETGAVVAEYEYDAFGATVSQSGALSDAFRHRFSTKPWIAALGAYDYGERLYSPVLRRWLSRDPMGEDGGVNLYAFVNNSPLLYLDPIGLDSFELRWVNKGPTYDGNNLWAAVWLWPKEIKGSGYVTSTLVINEYSFFRCDNSRILVPFHSGISTYTTYNLNALAKGIDGKHGADNGGIYKANGNTDGFLGGLYYSLIDTSMSLEAYKGKNLKCQKGNVIMTFSYTVHAGATTFKLLRNYKTGATPQDIQREAHFDLFPFYPEAIHKKFDPDPDVLYNDGKRDNACHANSVKLSVKWNRCEGKRILEFTPLQPGPNRHGR